MATTCGICVFGNDQTPLAGNVRRLRTTRGGDGSNVLPRPVDYPRRHSSLVCDRLGWHGTNFWFVTQFDYLFDVRRSSLRCD
jgi:hypothetical protein